MKEYSEFTLDDVAAALDYISPNLPYYDWSRCGRALYSEFGDKARDLFERWSATGDTYKKREFASYWRNFKKTKAVNISSFIYFAVAAGWRSKKEALTDEEKKERAEKRAAQKAAAEKKRRTAEKSQWEKLKQRENEFNLFSDVFAPTGYMLEKQMADLPKFAPVKLGRNKFNQPVLCWPFYDKLFNQGRFCGYEQISDKRNSLGKNKYSCEDARTDLGFITLGQCDHGRMPEKIFVVGGLADAYSAHTATGEIVVSAVGEGNIPGIIAKLSKRHPGIKFIAAPDNDKAGRTMIERAGGFWTTPATEGRDWSDVYVNEGPAAVKQQLLNVNGFETIKSDERYLSVQIKLGLNLIKSGMGTGKTTNMVQFIREKPHLKTLIISHRIALARSLQEDLSDKDEQGNAAINVEFYQDLIIDDSTRNLDQNYALRNAHVLVCSVDSLWRLIGSDWDMVFVDEFEQNLSQYFSSTITYGEHCLDYLRYVLTHSQYQILADAHLGDLTFSVCNYMGLNSGVFYDNTYKIAQNKKLYVYESQTHLIEETLQQIMRGGKRYIYANSKRQVIKIANAIEQERERKHFNGSVFVVHSETAKIQEVKDKLQKINEFVPEMDILIASPTLGTGFNIVSSTEEDGRIIGHNFDTTVGFLTSRVGTSEEGHQGLNRARDVSEFHLYIDPAERDEPTDANYIQDKLIEEPSAETMKLLSVDQETGNLTRKNSFYEWLFCKVKARNNRSLNSYKSRFLALAEADGYQIIHVAKNELAAKFGQTVTEEAAERTDRETLREIDHAPVHSGESFQDMMRNSENFPTAEVLKSKVNYDLHLDAATDEQIEQLLPIAQEVYREFSGDGANVQFNEVDQSIPFPESNRNALVSALTFSQSQNRYVDAIKKLSWVSVKEESAQYFDMKDIKHAESRVSWRNLSTKRRHMIKMLHVAGINEELVYNGKQWTAEEIEPVLSEWLRKKETQDRLYKYSGITVSANTLSNPVQWLNRHLRSFAVPIQSSKRHIGGGKYVNVYSVDTAQWEQVKTLVALRTQGIEESLQESECIDEEALTKTVEDFISAIKASEKSGKVKKGWPVLVEKLDTKCRLAGLSELCDAMTIAFASISHQFNDPHPPSVINKQSGQSGSFGLYDNVSNGEGSAYIEGGEKGSPFQRLKTASASLSPEHRNVVYEVAMTAIEKHQLPAHKVVAMMLEFELDNFKEKAVAWADSIRQAIVEGI